MIVRFFPLGLAVPAEEGYEDPAPWLIDEFIDSYVSWREECASVGNAYQRWLDCPGEDRRLAFANYQAALDREEKAASEHSVLCGRVAAAARGAG